jgi:flagellar hook-length control protein FliK
VEAIPQIGSTPTQDSPPLNSPRAATPGGGVFGKELERQIQTKKSAKDDGTVDAQTNKRSGKKVEKDNGTGAEPLTSHPLVRIDPNVWDATSIPVSLAVTTGDAGNPSAAVAETSLTPVVPVKNDAQTSAAIASTNVPTEIVPETASDEGTRSLIQVRPTAAGEEALNKVGADAGSKQSEAPVTTAKGDSPAELDDQPALQASSPKTMEMAAPALNANAATRDSGNLTIEKGHRSSAAKKNDVAASPEQALAAPRESLASKTQKPKAAQEPQPPGQSSDALAASAVTADAVSADSVEQPVRAIPFAMEGAAVKVSSKEVAANAAKSSPAQDNAVKAAAPDEKHAAIKEQKESSGAGEKQNEQRSDTQAAGQNAAALALHEQVKPETQVSNADKTAELFHRIQPTANSSSMPVKEANQVGQHENVRLGTTDLPVTNTTPAEVVHAVRMFERDGQAEMHIGVRSETLGVVDVKTTIHDGNVGVSIGVDRHESRSALVSELPGLESTLRDHDLRLGEVRFHDTASTLASGHDRGQQRQAQDFARPFAPAFYSDAKPASEKVELPIEVVTTAARGGISIHV